MMATAAVRFTALLEQIDRETVGFAWLDNLSRKIGMRRAHIVVGAFLFSFIFLFFGFGAAFFSAIIAVAYPMYASFKAVESTTKADDTQWLTYWVVYAVFTVIECFTDTLLFWFPLYYSVKVCFLLFCQLPHFRGAEFLYKSFIRPFFIKAAPEIEARVAHFREISGNVLRNAGVDIDLSPNTQQAPVPAEPELAPNELFGSSTPGKKTT